MLLVELRNADIIITKIVVTIKDFATDTESLVSILYWVLELDVYILYQFVLHKKKPAILPEADPIVCPTAPYLTQSNYCKHNK